MERSVQTRLGSAFGSAADAYAASRPGYPEGAVRWLAGDRPVDVLDLAAGTGSLTQALAEAGHRVIAAERSEQMLGRLRGLLPRTPAAVATAEQLPFASSSFDVVTVATAFHWFDAGPALAEMARILRPEGRISLLWNSRTKADDWAAELGDLLRSLQPPELTGDWGTGSVSALVGSDRFDDIEYAEFGTDQVLDRSALRGLVTSRSYVAALPPDRQAAVIGRVDALFARHTSPGRPTLVLTYRTQCWRAAKRS